MRPDQQDRKEPQVLKALKGRQASPELLVHKVRLDPQVHRALRVRQESQVQRVRLVQPVRLVRKEHRDLQGSQD